MDNNANTDSLKVLKKRGTQQDAVVVVDTTGDGVVTGDGVEEQTRFQGWQFWNSFWKLVSEISQVEAGFKQLRLPVIEVAPLTANNVIFSLAKSVAKVQYVSLQAHCET